MSDSNIFIILGYGIPKDILKDDNYKIYLRLVLNTIYSLSSDTSGTRAKKVYIIAAGGKTDVIRPYKRTEAQEIIRFFEHLRKTNEVAKRVTQNWKFIPEPFSVSTLENLVFSKEPLAVKKLKGNVHIFCEQTRTKRVTVLAEKVFGKTASVLPIDFDLSQNRYDPRYVSKKENASLKMDLKYLRQPNYRKAYHDAYLDKIKRIRKVSLKEQAAEIDAWQKEQIPGLNN